MQSPESRIRALSPAVPLRSGLGSVCALTTVLVSSSADLAAQHASAQLQVITPTAIAQTQGDSLTSFGYAIDNLINGSGLSDTPTTANLDTLTHSFGPTSVWVTQTQGDPTYFEDPSDHLDPQFTLTLDGPYSLSALAIWGYGGNTNEASDFTVEFSTDGGNSYSAATETVQTSGLVGNDHARLAFDVAHETNFVRLTITNNAKGRGFPGAGGDRVGLGEFRFVGSALQVITPTAIAQTQGDSLTGFSVAIGNLIDGSGLSDTPTTSNLDTVTHDSGPTANYWATHTQGAPSYFEDPRDLPVPQFTLTLDGLYSLSALVVWGLSTGPGNEASDFAVGFSTDGGNNYSSATETLSLDNTTGGSAARLSFGHAHEANFVRLTITNNAKGRGFPGSGGDRVGLGEIRFVGGALAPNAPPVALAGTLVLVVNVIAGGDTVNIEEQAAGFAISGNTGSVGGVNVTVRVGTTELTATSSNDDPATWSVNVPGDAAYIAGPSVAVTVSAAKAGYTPPSAEVRPLAVDLVAPTAPTYAAPASLQVGVALAALSPTGGSGIDEYGATGLPPGLRIDPGTGVIGGTPDRANASTASVTVRASDTAGNAATVPIAFPAVDTGDQALSGFRYSSDTVALGSAAPTMTAPTGAQTTLSYSAAPPAVCTVDPTSGALTLEGVGSCEITATAAGTDDYDEATVTYTVTVHRAPPDQDDALTTILDMDTAAPELLIAPTAIEQTQGDSLTSSGYVIDNLINGSGLSDTPTAANLDTVTHSFGRTSAWVTQTDGNPDYFGDSRNFPNPQFTLTLDGPYSLSELVIWGYGGNTNEASDFTVEFSTDGGNSYSTAAETVMTSGLVGNDHARLSFGQTHEANFVRLTMTNNAKGRGFPGSGGDRVGLGEIRFVASAVQVITPRAIAQSAAQRASEVIAPTAIAQTAGDVLTTYVIAHLIDGSGLSDTPTEANLDTVTHSFGSTSVWVTQTNGTPDYFGDSRNYPDPQFTLTLDGPYSLSELVIWGYGGNTNEASDFTLEFSTDGGSSYSAATETVQTSGVLGNTRARLAFGVAHEANFVRLTITNNAEGRGFPGSGGGRVGLGEIRFVGSAVASNAPPVAMAGALVTLVNTAGTLDLSTLAFDAEGGTLSYATTNPTNGSVSLTGAVVTYTPNTDYFGSDSFTYTVTDVDNAPATATVSVTVHRAPTALDASVATMANTALTYDLSPLAFDPDGDTLTWMVGAASHGMARLQFVTGGSVIYTPNAGYVGMDSFTYTVADGHGATATGTITVAVAPAGAVVVEGGSLVTPVGTAGTLDLSTLVLPPKASTLVYTVTDPSHGSVSLSGTTVTYTPDTGYQGTDSFTYTVTSSRLGGSATGTIIVVVAAPSSFSAGNLTVSVSYRGRITAFTGPDGTNFLPSGYSPALLKFIVADSADNSPSAARQLLPTHVRFLTDSSTFVLSFDEGIEARVQLGEEGEYATLELLSFTNPQHKDIRVAMWGPYELTIGEQVADVVGIAYSRDFAIGIQALNVQTFAGAPYEFTDDDDVSAFDRSALAVDPELGGAIGGTRVALNTYWQSAARLTSFGSVLQAYSRDYTASRVMKTTLDGKLIKDTRLVPAIAADDGVFKNYRDPMGSKIALFGLPRRGVEGGGLNRRQVFKREILEMIHRLERAEGLPYTTGNGGVHGKLADDSTQKVLQVDPSSTVQYGGSASSALAAGLDSIYIWQNPAGIFKHNGFVYEPRYGTYAQLEMEIQDIQKQGVRFGNHNLPGFANFAGHGAALNVNSQPLDRYISSRTSDLAQIMITPLVAPLTATGNTLTMAGRDSRFKDPGSRIQFVLIGNELIAYTGKEDHGTDDTRLTGLTRGAFRTSAGSYSAGQRVGALFQHSNNYNAVSWGDNTAYIQGQAVADSINNTGMTFISLDGIESYWRDAYINLAGNLFYDGLHGRLQSKDFSGEASRLFHYNWHFHNRFMWGEAGTQVLKGTVHYQLANMAMMSRNFMRVHTGGFYGQNNNATDFEWVGAKIAAYNAGTLIRSQGFSSDERVALKRWNQAQEAGAFSDYQRVRLGPWERMFALEEVNNGGDDWKTGQRWRLRDRAMTLTYNKAQETDADSNTRSVTAVSYGSASNPFYVARPWAGFPTRNIAGDALVSTSSRRDAGYQGDNAVDGFIGIFNPSYYSSRCAVYDDDGTCTRLAAFISTSEWHTASADSERWIKLTWDRPQKIRTVFLSDRSHPDNNVTGYTIEFEDGTRLSGTNLPVRGAYGDRSVGTGSVESSWVKVSITSHVGSNPGLGEVVVIAEDPGYKGHLASNATILERPQNHHPSHAATGNDERLFDGVIDSAVPNYISVGDNRRFIVIDLGSAVMVDGLNVWRYYRDVRQYHDVVYQLSTTSNFSTDVTTVFNNDGDNSSQQGAGSDPEYREGPSGKPVYFPPVRARYLRLWSSGNTQNNNNHYTEVEVYGLRNLAFHEPVSQTGDAGYDSGSSLATDGNIRNGAWNIGPKATWRHRQLDIGGPWAIDSLRVWHELSDSRRIRYKDVVFRLSTTADFSSDVTTVFNNDLDNSLGLGAGTDGEYDETESGKIVHFPRTRARYIRLHTFGNNYDDQNRLLEVMVGQRASLVRSEAPVAMAGALATVVNTAGNLDLSTLASDADGGTLSYATTNPTNGSVSLTGAVVTYTPNDGYFGSDSFTYSVTDVDNAPATATVSVTVHRAPTAQDASVTTPANTALTYDLSPLAFDPDGDTLTWMVGVASHGMARLQFVTGGSVIYTPNAGYVGMDSFTYTVADGHGATATGTITVAVAPAGAVVVEGGSLLVTPVGTAGTLDLSTLVLRPKAGTLVYTVTDPSHGSVSLSGTTVTYTPDTGYQGTDSFTYTVTSSRLGGSATGTITVVVAGPSSFSAGNLTVSLNSRGRITAFTGPNGTDFLPSGYSPALLKFIVADSAADSPSAARQLLPTVVRFLTDSSTYVLSFDEGIEARVQLGEEDKFATLELLSFSNPQNKDIRVAMWGPYELTIGEQVADVIGVAYSRDFAIGMQSVVVNTLAGAPFEFTNRSNLSPFDYSAQASQRTAYKSRNGENLYWTSAARLMEFGSVLQAYSRDYSQDRMARYITDQQIYSSGRPEARFVGGISDPDHPLYSHRGLQGSKIALFGLQRRQSEGGGLNRRQVFKKEILRVIHAIEVDEGLPYTTGNGGVWNKFAEDSRQKVLFHHTASSNDATAAVSAGLDSVYYWLDPAGVFVHNGFEYAPLSSTFGGSYATLRGIIQSSHNLGVRWGTHTLPGFAHYAESYPTGGTVSLDAAPLDRYISTRPKDLAEDTRTTIIGELTASDNTIVSGAPTPPGFQREIGVKAQGSS